jgi:hypothetical protein
MIEPHRLHYAVVEGDAILLDIVKIAMRGHLGHVYGEIRVRHLLFNRALKSASSAGRVEYELVVGTVIEGIEEGNALNVVPMKVGKENVCGDRLFTGFHGQMLAKIAEASAAIKDVHVAVDAHFDARGIAAVAQIFYLRSRSRAAHPPEFHLHPAVPAPDLNLV